MGPARFCCAFLSAILVTQGATAVQRVLLSLPGCLWLSRTGLDPSILVVLVLLQLGAFSCLAIHLCCLCELRDRQSVRGWIVKLFVLAIQLLPARTAVATVKATARELERAEAIEDVVHRQVIRNFGESGPVLSGREAGTAPCGLGGYSGETSGRS